MPKRGLTIPEEGAQVIRARLKTLSWSQEAFAEEIMSVTSRTLRNWLSGKTTIDEHSLENMLMHIGLGVSDVFRENLPRTYQEKSTMSLMVSTFKKLLLSGDVRRAIEKYRKYLKGLAEHVSFHRIPLKGPYLMFDHDETYHNHYAVVSLTVDPSRESSTYVLSWRFLNLVRVNLGEITVTTTETTVKPFFQKYSHTVSRADVSQPALFGFWLARDGSLFFVEGKDGLAVDAQITEFITEKEHDERQDEIAVFWRGTQL